MLTVSLVEVSPSMETMLKLFTTSVLRAFSSISAEIAASVVMNTSMVARLGWIIPLPFPMAPIRQVFPPISNSQAASFITVSVVIMASAAALFPSYESPFTRSSMPSAIGLIFNGCPITPVEATITSSLSMPRASAVSPHIFSAISIPSALQVLAFPLFTMTACAMPSAK